MNQKYTPRRGKPAATKVTYREVTVRYPTAPMTAVLLQVQGQFHYIRWDQGKEVETLLVDTQGRILAINPVLDTPRDPFNKGGRTILVEEATPPQVQVATRVAESVSERVAEAVRNHTPGKVDPWYNLASSRGEVPSQVAP